MVISYYDGYFPYYDGPHDMKFIVSLSVCIIDFKGNDKLLFKKYAQFVSSVGLYYVP